MATNTEPLFTDGDLEQLARGIKGLTKDQQFSVYERFVAIRGHYEKERAKPDAQVAPDFPDSVGWWAFKGTWWGRPVTRVFRVEKNLSIWSGATPVKLGTDIVGKFYKLTMPWETAPVEGQPVQADVLDAIFEMRELAAESIPYAGEYFDDKWQLSERFEAKYPIVDAWLKEMGHAAYRDDERPAAEAGATHE